MTAALLGVTIAGSVIGAAAPGWRFNDTTPATFAGMANPTGTAGNNLGNDLNSRREVRIGGRRDRTIRVNLVPARMAVPRPGAGSPWVGRGRAHGRVTVNGVAVGGCRTMAVSG